MTVHERSSEHFSSWCDIFEDTLLKRVLETLCIPSACSPCFLDAIKWKAFQYHTLPDMIFFLATGSKETARNWNFRNSEPHQDFCTLSGLSQRQVSTNVWQFQFVLDCLLSLYVFHSFGTATKYMLTCLMLLYIVMWLGWCPFMIISQIK